MLNKRLRSRPLPLVTLLILAGFSLAVVLLAFSNSPTYAVDDAEPTPEATEPYRVLIPLIVQQPPHANSAAPVSTSAVGPGSQRAAGDVVTLPGRVQAEDYKFGGSGVAYFDLTTGNNGGVYRSDNVDLTVAQDTGGGYMVGWIQNNEWLAYDVDISQAGFYNLVARVMSNDNPTQSIRILVDGANVGSFSFTNTNGVWVNITSSTLSLPAGPHELRLVMGNWGGNLNYFDVVSSSATPTSTPVPPTPTPTATPTNTLVPGAPTPTPGIGGVLPLPGRIQAEDYKLGGSGVAYFDLTTGNNGGVYRSDDVDLTVAQDTGGGYMVGWVQNNEWLAYDVDISQAGFYNLVARVMSNDNNAQSIRILVDGADVGGFSFTSTSGVWVNITSSTLSLPAGPHELRLVMGNWGGNLNYFDVVSSSATPTSTPVPPTPTPTATPTNTLVPGAPTPTPGIGGVLPLPGRIQAEDYKLGGSGVAYFDLTVGNNGGVYRSDNVDLTVAQDIGGGYMVGWVQNNEWLAYDVDISQAGLYNLVARVMSNDNNTQSIRIRVDGADVGGFSFSSTSGVWVNITSSTLSLPAGPHELRLVMGNWGGNLNYFDVVSSSATPTSTPVPPTATNTPVPPTATNTPDPNTPTATPSVRSLGSVSQLSTPSSCGGQTCYQIAVQCPGIDTMNATLKVGEPTGGTPKGTILFASTWTGQGLWENMSAEAPRVLAELQAAGYRSVQLQWTTNAWWRGYGYEGQAKLACRPATVARWVYDNLYTPDPGAAYCATGHSNGAAQIGYALAQYGLADITSAALFDGGPNWSRIDEACLHSDPTYQSLWAGVGERDVIDWAFNFFPAGTGICATQNVAQRPLFDEASLALGNWQYIYPHTMVGFLFGELDTTTTAAQGQYFHDLIVSKGSPLVSIDTTPGTGHFNVSTVAGADRIRDFFLNECRPQ